MMQPAQHRFDVHPQGNADSMPALLVLRRGRVRRRIGQAGTQIHVWAAAIVVLSSRFENFPQMIFRHGDQLVQAFASDRADRALANCVCLGIAWRRFQYSKTEGIY